MKIPIIISILLALLRCSAFSQDTSPVRIPYDDRLWYGFTESQTRLIIKDLVRLEEVTAISLELENQRSLLKETIVVKDSVEDNLRAQINLLHSINQQRENQLQNLRQQLNATQKQYRRQKRQKWLLIGAGAIAGGVVLYLAE